MASSVNQRLIKKEAEDSDDECTFLSSNKNTAMKGDSKQAIDIDDDVDDYESISGPSTQPQKASVKENLTIVKEESDEDKKSLMMKELKPQKNEGITVEQFFDTIVVEQDTGDEDADDPDAENDEGSDYHDSGASDDSYDSDDSEAQLKKLKSKQGVAKVKELLEECEMMKDAYLYKMGKGEKLSLKEHRHLEKLNARITQAKKGLDSHTRGSRPRTAREYWQRQLERETEEEQRKRKPDNDETDPRKVQRTDAQTRPGGNSGNYEFLRAAELFTSNGIDNEDAETGEPANEIKATTHASQMQQIMAGMPEGNDTRHTKTQRDDLIEAKKCFGFKRVTADNGQWKLKGMKTSLHSQQLAGASWMTMREAMELHPAGGILADEMGLGKTITTLATIIGHPPEPEDIKEFCKATLIIADNSHSALRTWMEQINNHASAKFADKCVIYSKSLGKPLDWWRRKNVVITNLNELRTQFLSKKEYQELKAKWAGDEAGFLQTLAKSKKIGSLFRVNWYRVVLDEAHGVKCQTSAGTLAVWHLNAKYRWALTGTPLSNKLEGMSVYGRDMLLAHMGRILSLPEVHRLQIHDYNEKIPSCEQAKQNFEALVSLVMLRRKQTDKFLGRTMVPLPKSHRQDVWVPISGWEKIHLDILDGSYQAKLLDAQADNHETLADEQQQDPQEDEDVSDNESEVEFEKDGTEGSEATNLYRVQNLRCMRLVQLTSHPLNLEKFYREDNREKEIRLTLARFKSEITKASIEDDQKALEASLKPAYSSGLRQLELAIKDKFGGAQEMAELLKLAANEKRVQGITCRLCRKNSIPVKPVQSTNCEHIYCTDCLVIALSGMGKSGRPLAPSQCRKKGCSHKLGLGEAIKTPACIDAAVKAIRGFKEPGRDSIGTRWTGGPNERASFFRAVCGRNDIGYGPVKMPLGSKLKATLAVVLTWMQEAPDDKMIIYVQWTRTAKSLGCVLESMGIKFVYYNRMANKKQKARALDEFTNNGEIKILVSSMKCGGQSFNLQMANRVIIVDEWWNKAVEEQAFKRVFRPGQLKETYLVRIMANDTIDERIILLQNAKEAIIKAALQDNEMHPHFSGDLQLRMLFSEKDEQTLIGEMEKETRAKQTKQ
ncbi:RIS1-like protein [Fusarium sp. NRRL 25303]|nr:RIS1-like protein [Fusarium sp. NRRL 25303]